MAKHTEAATSRRRLDRQLEVLELPVESVDLVAFVSSVLSAASLSASDLSDTFVKQLNADTFARSRSSQHCVIDQLTCLVQHTTANASGSVTVLSVKNRSIMAMKDPASVDRSSPEPLPSLSKSAL